MNAGEVRKLLVNKYQILLVDPPWTYENKTVGGSGKSGSRDKYPLMTVEEICGLKDYIHPVLDTASVAFLWVPEPLGDFAYKVLDAWEFSYRGRITWVKRYPGKQRGLGYWFSTETEGLYFGVRGKVKPFRSMLPNWLELPVEGHSKKPEKFRQLIEQASKSTLPNARKLELFGRRFVKGWTVLGLDLDQRDIRDSLQMLAAGEIPVDDIETGTMEEIHSALEGWE